MSSSAGLIGADFQWVMRLSTESVDKALEISPSGG